MHPLVKTVYLNMLSERYWYEYSRHRPLLRMRVSQDEYAKVSESQINIENLMRYK